LPKSEKIKKEERGKLKDEENQKKSLLILMADAVSYVVAPARRK
jgi:hypothetical protein